MATLNSPMPARYTEVLGNIVDYLGYDLFDFDYTLPSNIPTTKAALQQAFIDRYYFREICCETVGRFLTYLSNKWRALIPLYAQLMQAASAINPKDFTNDHYDDNGTTVFNDAPKGVVEFDGKHATNYTTSKRTTSGNRGRMVAESVAVLRDVLFEPVQAFLDEFEDLFFALYQ